MIDVPDGTPFKYNEWYDSLPGYVAAEARFSHALKAHSQFMVQPCDSFYIKHLTVGDYERIFRELVDLFAFADSFEVLNEGGGDWLGDDESVLQKLTLATNIVRAKGKKTHLCLYFENPTTVEDIPNSSMMKFANKIPHTVREGIDSVGISYYPQDNSGQNLLMSERLAIFEGLQKLFPMATLANSEFGFSDTTHVKDSDITRVCLQNWKRTFPETIPYLGANFWNFSEFAVSGRSDCMLAALKP